MHVDAKTWSRALAPMTKVIKVFPMPILGAVEVVSDGQKMKMRGTDLDTEIVVSDIPVSGPPLSLGLEAKQLAVVLADTKGDLKVSEDGLINSPAISARVPKYDVVDFPVPQAQPNGPGVRVTAQDLGRAIRYASRAQSRQISTRLWLQNLAYDAKCFLGACDGHRVHTASVDLGTEAFTLSLSQARAIGDVIKVLKAQSGNFVLGPKTWTLDFFPEHLVTMTGVRKDEPTLHDTIKQILDQGDLVFKMTWDVKSALKTLKSLAKMGPKDRDGHQRLTVTGRGILLSDGGVSLAFEPRENECPKGFEYGLELGYMIAALEEQGPTVRLEFAKDPSLPCRIVGDANLTIIAPRRRE